MLVSGLATTALFQCKSAEFINEADTILSNFENDLIESENIITEHADLVNELVSGLVSWEAEMDGSKQKTK